MNVKDLKKALVGLSDDTEFLVSSDEELNTLFNKWQVAELSDGDKLHVVIYGLSGSEQE